MEEKIVIVTGGASGIGYAIAKELTDCKSKVVIGDINAELLKKSSDEIGCDSFLVDLSQQASCKGLVDYVVQNYGKVDILVNVGGIQNICPIKDFPEEKWNLILSIMLTAPFLLTKYCWPYMEKQNWGRIINISSIHGLVASEFKSAYVSAKHGLIGLTKTAAMEAGEHGITVNAICPAYVKTPLVDKQIAAQASTHKISEDEVISKIMLQKSAIKKLLNPKEVADMVKYLCSDSAANITGSTITIDGGWTAN